MKIIELAFSVYPVTDMKRARSFYEGTLGLKAARSFEQGEQSWVEYDIGPATLALGKGAPDWKPNPGGGAVGLEVDDFDQTVEHLKKAGCKFATDVMDTPVCRMIVVSDPDGNSVVMHKRKEVRS